MKKTLSSLSLAVLTIAISSCSPKAYVNGQLDTGRETFTGTIEEYLSKRGKMKIEMKESQVQCNGKFTNPRGSMAKGYLRCEDGRTGEYRFESRRDGHGYGNLNGENFRFEFDRSDFDGDKK